MLYKINIKLYLLSIICIISSFLIYFFNKDYYHPINHQGISINSSSKNIIIKNFKSQIYPLDNNSIKYALTSPLISINPKNNTAQLLNPKILIYSDNNPTWQAKANLSIINFINNNWSQIKKIQLLNDVSLIQLNTQKPLSVSSTKITVYPESNLITSNDKIIISQNKFYTTGIGLHANLQTHVFELLKEVRSNYVSIN